MKPLNTLFVVADGGRARWIHRSDAADDFKTIKELTASADTRGEPDGVAFEGGSGQRFNIGEKDDAVQQHRLRFAGELAEVINAEANSGGFERLALVAPARMLAAIRRHLSAAASAKLARTLAKDLTKTPDHAMGAWLRELERE